MNKESILWMNDAMMREMNDDEMRSRLDDRQVVKCRRPEQTMTRTQDGYISVHSPKSWLQISAPRYLATRSLALW